MAHDRNARHHPSQTSPSRLKLHNAKTRISLVTLIPISSIAILKRQRKTLDPVKVSELAESIKANGLIQAIVVRAPLPSELAETGERQYVLSVGGRRTAAHILLGRAEIEAIIKEEVSDPIKVRIIELEENIRREDLSWQEEVEAREEITNLLIETQRVTTSLNRKGDAIEVVPLTPSRVAEQIGVSPAQLSRDLALASAIKKDPTLKLAASKGSAIRAASFKTDMKARAAAVSQNSTSDLSSKLFCADASQFIRTIPSQSIDLVFSDLPYGIDYFDVRKGATEATKGHYDDSAESVKDFIADIVPHCLRVVKPSGWVVFFMCYEWHDWLQGLVRTCCIQHAQYTDETGICFQGNHQGESPCRFLRPELPPWIWTRRGSGNHGHWPELHASNRYEILVVVNGGSAKLTKKPVENVLDFPPFDGERLHEMQKPHELCREIIERTTLVGERVLDVCFGSGAHLAAAASLGRDFVGCDSNPDNLTSALSLVSQHYDPQRAEILSRARGPVGPRLIVDDQLDAIIEGKL